MKTAILMTLILFILSSTSYGKEPQVPNPEYSPLYTCMRSFKTQDSISMIERDRLLKNAGIELIKAERKFYLGVSFVALGGITYLVGQGNKQMNVLGFGFGAFGALFSLEYVYHIGKAGRILSGTNLRAQSGIHIKSAPNGIGLAFKF
ncbi:hypothetical protein [Saccharicrinis sp. FJH54]|uniref:hypothetical protein n=1 Tax=Saccharicrinis sp. FJH54 TaxID=3344665 RepID=UPI0035D3E13F